MRVQTWGVEKTRVRKVYSHAGQHRVDGQERSSTPQLPQPGGVDALRWQAPSTRRTPKQTASNKRPSGMLRMYVTWLWHATSQPPTSPIPRFVDKHSIQAGIYVLIRTRLLLESVTTWGREICLRWCVRRSKGPVPREAADRDGMTKLKPPHG